MRDLLRQAERAAHSESSERSRASGDVSRLTELNRTLQLQLAQSTGTADMQKEVRACACVRECVRAIARGQHRGPGRLAYRN